MIVMTFEEFKKRFMRSSVFDRYLNILAAIFFLSVSAYLLTAMFIIPLMKFPDGKIRPCIIVLLFLSISVSILVVQKSRYKITIWKNGSSEQENIKKVKMMLEYLGKPENRLHENYASVFYEASWWSGVSFDIHLFAGTHFIAINVRNIQGFGYDFGKAKGLRDSLEIYSFDIKSEG